MKLSELSRLSHSTLSHAAPPYGVRVRTRRQHLTSMGLVVLLHVALLWALTSGLARQVVRLSQHTVEAVLMSESPPAAAPAPSPTPRRPTPLPPLPSTASPTAVTQTVAAAAVLPAPTAPSIRTGAAIQPSAHCAKPDYPSASRRLEEEGTVVLKFLIGVDGKVLQADIEKSSGFNRLDEAARQALSKCQFRAGTVDGKPEQSWATIAYKWRLE